VRTFAQVWEHIARRATEIGATEFRLYQFVSSVERLDDVLSRGRFRIDVSHILAIKIDMEGMEAAVLRGAVRALVTQSMSRMIRHSREWHIYSPEPVCGLSPDWVDALATAAREMGFRTSTAKPLIIHYEAHERARMKCCVKKDTLDPMILLENT
jgi:hypothetical protein